VLLLIRNDVIICIVVVDDEDVDGDVVFVLLLFIHMHIIIVIIIIISHRTGSHRASIGMKDVSHVRPTCVWTTSARLPKPSATGPRTVM